MNGSWMLASTLVAVLFACAAYPLARVATFYSGVSIRWIWAAATAASLAFSLAWLRPAPVVTQAAARAPASVTAPPTTNAAPAAPVQKATTRITPPAIQLPTLRLPSISGVASRTLRNAWVIASLVLGAMLVVATARIITERRAWYWRDIANTRVLVSKSFGPAIIGIRKPNIVVPEWVLALDDMAQRAIITHEAEHLRARDPMLIVVGLAAVVLMPWNIGLWMSWRGLRRAIELDCDARVLARGIDSADYARVLLGAWKLARGSWVPAPAFAERASGLGARIEHLMRPEPRRRVMRTVLGGMLATMIIAAACTMPSPYRDSAMSLAPHPLVIIDGVVRSDLPPMSRYVGPVVAETTKSPKLLIRYRGKTEPDSAAINLYPTRDETASMWFVSAPASEAQFGPEAKAGALVMYTTKYRDAGKAMTPPADGVRAEMPPPPPVGPFAALFTGITLRPEQSAEAQRIIVAARATMDSLRGPVLALYRARNALWDRRDADLRGLLTNDADRAKYDVSQAARRKEYHSIESEPEFVDLIYQTYTYEVTFDAAAQKQVRAILARALHEEMTVWANTPDAWAAQRAAIYEKRDANVAALIRSDEERIKAVERMKSYRESDLRRK